MLQAYPEVKSKIDKLWDMFYSGGMSNPISAIEQISYLIFMKRLEDMDNQQRKAAERRGQKYTSIFKGKETCRWSHWMHYDAERMLQAVVTKDQLSLAIGKKGMNVRLASILVGCRIEINQM